jgi:hypothetical protein
VIIIVTEESIEKLYQQKLFLDKRKKEILEKYKALKAELAQLEEIKKLILHLRSLVRGPSEYDRKEQEQNQEQEREKTRFNKSQSVYDFRIF